MAKRRTRRKAFSDQLRRIIEDSDLSRNQLCKAAEVDPSHLHRFVHGTGRLTNDSIDKLVEVLGVRLVQDRKAGK